MSVLTSYSRTLVFTGRPDRRIRIRETMKEKQRRRSSRKGTLCELERLKSCMPTPNALKRRVCFRQQRERDQDSRLAAQEEAAKVLISLTQSAVHAERRILAQLHSQALAKESCGVLLELVRQNRSAVEWIER